MMRTLVEAIACAGTLLLVGCSTQPIPATTSPSGAGGVTFIRPRCVEVRSCLLGQVIAAESATPLSRAAIFLEREVERGGIREPGTAPLRIVTMTDDQGVFTVVDAPEGRYRMAVYKDARRLEARGLELGAPGTTVVPVRLPPG